MGDGPSKKKQKTDYLSPFNKEYELFQSPLSENMVPDWAKQYFFAHNPASNSDCLVLGACFMGSINLDQARNMSDITSNIGSMTLPDLIFRMETIYPEKQFAMSDELDLQTGFKYFQNRLRRGSITLINFMRATPPGHSVIIGKNINTGNIELYDPSSGNDYTTESAIDEFIKTQNFTKFVTLGVRLKPPDQNMRGRKRTATKSIRRMGENPSAKKRDIDHPKPMDIPGEREAMDIVHEETMDIPGEREAMDIDGGNKYHKSRKSKKRKTKRKTIKSRKSKKRKTIKSRKSKKTKTKTRKH